MGKYNYYDDDFENEKRENRLSDAFIYIGAKLKSAKNKASRSNVFSFEEVAHGEPIKALRTMPNVRALILKFLAFIFFIIAVIGFIAGFAHTINSQNKRNSQFYADAAQVCTNYISDYGSTKWEYLNEDEYGKDSTYLSGFCYARQMDFDGDGNDELMLCYNNGTEYILEVWGYANKEFTTIYSEVANHTEEPTDGYWLSFFHKNNKYYLCKSEPETPDKVVLYALKGSSFKKNSECSYDCKDNIYTYKGKINAYDFETIKLSTIKASKAEQIVELVDKTLQTFSGSSSVASETKSDAQLRLDAYYNIVLEKIKKYGNPKVDSNNDGTFVDGVCYVSLVDFDKDDNSELVIAYRKMVKTSSIDYMSGNSIVVENPTYCVEVYGWNGTIAKKLLSRDSVSNYLEDPDIYYLMLQHTDKADYLCINDYSFRTSDIYTAASQVYALEDGSFYQDFNARMEYEYGWKNYYINGEYSYEDNFYEEAKRVPLFLDDYGKVDSDEYEVVYFACRDGEDYDAVVNNCVKNIQTLNKNYNPDMKLD